MARKYLSEYRQSCKDFSKETRSWGGFTDTKHYTSYTGYGGQGSTWHETSDNAHGGLDVSWAFGMKMSEIDERVEEKFFDLVLQELENLDCCEDLESAVECAKEVFSDRR